MSSNAANDATFNRYVLIRPIREITISEDVVLLLSTGALRERFQSIRGGSVSLSVRDSAIESIGELVQVTEEIEDNMRVGALTACFSLLHVDLSSCTSLKVLGAWSFSDCTSLKGATLPNNITTIGRSAFHTCKSLDNVFLPDSLTSLDGRVFGRCSALSSITFPDKLKSIGQKTFVECASLERVVFNKNLETLGKQVFVRCSALKSITLPDKLEVIERMAFFECSSLERVVCNKTLKTIGEGAFGCCSALKSITLTDKLKTIEKAAFIHCTSLKRVVCNKKLKTIGHSAFECCPKLEDIQLASSSISFVEYSFNQCDRLIEIADAAGFPSNEFLYDEETDEDVSEGEGVSPYLLDRFERSERRQHVLLAYLRFSAAVNSHPGTETEKHAAVKQQFNEWACPVCTFNNQSLHLTCGMCAATKVDAEILVGTMLSAAMRGGGAKGVLSSILSFL